MRWRWVVRSILSCHRAVRLCTAGVVILLLATAFSRPAQAQTGQPNLTIDMLADRRQVAPGNRLQYYRLYLRTTAPVQNVAVRFDFPTGFSLSGSPIVTSGITCAPPADSGVRCTVSALQTSSAPETSAQIILTVNASTTVGTYRLPAWIDPENRIAESDEADNASGVLTTVTWAPENPSVPAWPELSLSPSMLPAVTPGSTMSVRLLVRNAGTADTRAVQVRVSYPAGIRYLAPSAFNAFACANTPPSGGSPGVVACSRSTLQAGDTAMMELVVQMPPTLGSYRIDFSAASVFAAPASASSTVQVVRPDLSIGVMAPYAATVGAPFTYTVTVRSHLVAVENVVVEIPVPADLALRKVTATGKFTCTHASALITCTSSSLDGDATASIKVTATPFQAHTIHLQATVDPSNLIAEGDETNNTRGARLPVWP
jgi:hypothetical protein